MTYLFLTKMQRKQHPTLLTLKKNKYKKKQYQTKCSLKHFKLTWYCLKLTSKKRGKIFPGWCQSRLSWTRRPDPVLKAANRLHRKQVKHSLILGLGSRILEQSGQCVAHDEACSDTFLHQNSTAVKILPEQGNLSLSKSSDLCPHM
ncbi:hypothetical protein GOODEAATRI_002368 [Goodea atripinnis]|uniref:Uncharacterized protein n=1 Tax=Goodea atripinnis TaxID=208336 RepID=A0ABV0MPX3_9TELE